MIGEIIGSIALAAAIFFIFVIGPLWVGGLLIQRLSKDKFVPDNRHPSDVS